MPAAYRGVIFDVDGVLVDSPHEKAWRESLRQLREGDWAPVRASTTWSPDGFTSELYARQVSGLPRMVGARAALEHFQVPDLERRSDEYGQRKQAMVVELIESGDFTAYPDALRMLIAVKDGGARVAAASSSKNAGLLLRRVDLGAFAAQHRIDSPSVRPGQSLLDLFDVDVSGRDFARGKPDPEIFLTAARELGIDPSEAVVIEDAQSGVAAALAGGMAAVGIARHDDAALLAAATLVVTSLDDLDVAALARGQVITRGQ
ncbi:MAG: HAD-IA family hydrolase [Dermatophilaceae bacterium]